MSYPPQRYHGPAGEVNATFRRRTPSPTTRCSRSRNGSVGWTLDDESLRLLTETSDRPLPYPQRVLRDAMRRPRTQ